MCLSQLDQEVHIWRGDASDLAPIDLLQETTLAPDEIAKAAGMKSPVALRRFVWRRSLLRMTLARYTGLPAPRLRLLKSESNRKFLFGWEDLHFSTSTSQDLMLIAVSRGRRVGVNVEFVDVDFDHHAVAESWFAPAERASLGKMSLDHSKSAFFRYWTRKQAYMKASGWGRHKRSAIEVPLVNGGPIALHSGNKRAELMDWSLTDLAVDPSYTAALAVEGSGWTTRCMWQAAETITA